MTSGSVLLLSGGLDSTANLALEKKSGQPLLALFADYGQKSVKKELEATEKLCAFFNVPLETVDLRWLGRLGGSALTDPGSGIPSVWVPNRNGLLLAVGAAYAERRRFQRVILGFNAEEAQNFPDNSEEFMNASTRALFYSTKTQVEVFSHTVKLQKPEIVSLLKREVPQFPYHLLWSCYEGTDQPCGTCESCQRLTRAMQ